MLRPIAQHIVVESNYLNSPLKIKPSKQARPSPAPIRKIEKPLPTKQAKFRSISTIQKYGDQNKIQIENIYQSKQIRNNFVPKSELDSLIRVSQMNDIGLYDSGFKSYDQIFDELAPRRPRLSDIDLMQKYKIVLPQLYHSTQERPHTLLLSQFDQSNRSQTNKPSPSKIIQQKEIPAHTSEATLIPLSGPFKHLSSIAPDPIVITQPDQAKRREYHLKMVSGNGAKTQPKAVCTQNDQNTKIEKRSFTIGKRVMVRMGAEDDLFGLDDIDFIDNQINGKSGEDEDV